MHTHNHNHKINQSQAITKYAPSVQMNAVIGQPCPLNLWDVYSHFYIFTQINDLVYPGKEKKVCKHTTLK